MVKINLKSLILIILMISSVKVNLAQDELEPISADNVSRLKPVIQIDYADTGVDSEIGWFAHDEVNDQFAVLSEADRLVILDENGDIINEAGFHKLLEDEVVQFIDAQFANGLLVYAYREGTMYHVVYSSLVDIDEYFRWFVFESDNQPQALWIGCETDAIESCRPYLEVVDTEGDTFVLRLASVDVEDFTPDTIPSVVVEGIFDRLPYPPADDDSAFVRVGRIPLPYVLTSSVDGLVKLWNLETGMVEHSIQVENGPAVFGNSNYSATDFAWRDPASIHLNLLDFESGENAIIADLGETYAQYYLLANDASVVIAVNFDFVPNVFAWDVSTGEKLDLGAYRDCERIPDKVELSRDGTTLIIGCDKGIELWRILEDGDS